MNPPLVTHPPLVTLIVPCRPDRAPRYPLPMGPHLEVLVVTGTNVSFQRNQAAQLAAGELLYFLDDDCLLTVETLEGAVAALQQLGPDWAAVGGPSLTHPQASSWEKLFGSILSLWLATLMTQPRNTKVGGIREVQGTEMISCNLLIRRSWLEKVGGFDVDLHPAEDVEFMQRLRAAGGRLQYRPDMVVWRHRRHHPATFLWQYFRYGMARGLLIWRKGRVGQVIYLLPLWLVVEVGLGWNRALLPYLAIVLVASLQVIGLQGNLFSGLLALILIPAMHLAYGLGLGVGLLRAVLGWHAPPPPCILQVERRRAP